MTRAAERQTPPDEHVPTDTFPVRLAIVRTEMGWNYVEASKATGINAETWRLWEKGERRCTDIDGNARRISHATGVSWRWLMVGGPLTEPPVGIEPTTYRLSERISPGRFARAA